MTALRTAFPRDGVLLVDSGAHRAFAGHYWSAYEPRTYISATNLDPMGWAIPAAIGVQCARPDRRVAVITGDGCMHMHGMDVQTAARYRLPIVYVVVNNGALGNVWLRAHQYGPLPTELTTVPDHDWAGFARSLGARERARCEYHRRRRHEGGQGLPHTSLRLQCRSAGLILSQSYHE